MNNQSLSEILGLKAEPKVAVHAPEVATQKQDKVAILFRQPIQHRPGHKILCAPSSILEASGVSHAKTQRLDANEMLLEINSLKINQMRKLAILLTPYNHKLDKFAHDQIALSTSQLDQSLADIQATTKKHPDLCYDFHNAALFRLLIVSPKQALGKVYEALRNSPYSRFSLKQITNRRKNLQKVFRLRYQMGYITNPTTTHIINNKPQSDHFVVWEHPAGDIEKFKEITQAKLLRKSMICSQLALECAESTLGEYAHEFASNAIDAGGVNKRSLVAKGLGILLGGIPEYLISLEQTAAHADHFGSPDRFEKALITCAQNLQNSPSASQARSLLGSRQRSNITSCVLRRPLAMTAQIS